jgi:DNA (cytosine-5)-methyltransferase 1
MYRVICESKPRWVLAENVPGILSAQSGMVIEQVYIDLESAGYETLPPLVIPACGVDAPHRRDRVWIVGYAGGSGCSWIEWGRPREKFKNRCPNVADAKSQPKRTGLQPRESRQKWRGRSGNRSRKIAVADTDRPGRKKQCWSESAQTKLQTVECCGWWPAESGICRVAYGIPNRVDRLAALGDSIVPQAVIPIMEAMKDVDEKLWRGNG